MVRDTNRDFSSPTDPRTEQQTIDGDSDQTMFGNSNDDGDDSSTDATNYDFFTTRSDIESRYSVRKWKLGNHAARPAVDTDDLEKSAEMVSGIDDDLASIFSEAASKAQQAEVNDYECQVCGLTHGHSPDKHDIRDSDELNVTPEFAEMMEFNAACHCGVNELAMLVDFYDEIRATVFADADDLDEYELEDRFDEVRAAADSAKIATPTENRINTIRASLEQQFDE